MKRVKVIFTAMMLCIAVAMPSNAYAADAEDWASLEGWLSSINGKLGYIYADTTNIYTALSVVKDTATTISTSVTNIKSSVDDMTDDLAYLPAISSTATNINTYTSGIYTRLANLSTIKDIVDSHTTLLTTINNNINNVWADVQLIKDTTGYINSAFTTANGHLSNINENIITVGESITGIADDISAIRSNLESVTAVYSIGGNRLFGYRVAPMNNNDSGVSTWTNNVVYYLNNIYSKVGTISTSISTMSTDLQDDLTTLNTSINSMSTALQDDLSAIPTSIGDMSTALQEDLTSIGTDIAAIRSNLESITSVYIIGENRYQGIRVMPMNNNDAGVSTWTNNVIYYLSHTLTSVDGVTTSIGEMSTALQEDLTSIGTDIAAIRSNLESITSAYIIGENRYQGIRVMPMNNNDAGVSTWTNNVIYYLSNALSGINGISSAIETIAGDISSIRELFESVISVYNIGDNRLYGVRVMPMNNNDAGVSTWTNNVIYYLSNTLNGVNNLYNAVPDGLADVYDMLRAIYDKMSIPADSTQIIGDFDTDALDEEILDLKSVMSQVAPFGAITLVSAEFSILSSVAPVDYPQFVFPFDFGGFDQTLVLDLSWLEQAKGFINFFSMFMLIYCLTIWSIKFIKE